jgi:hypothetical protein
VLFVKLVILCWAGILEGSSRKHRNRYKNCCWKEIIRALGRPPEDGSTLFCARHDLVSNRENLGMKEEQEVSVWENMFQPWEYNGTKQGTCRSKRCFYLNLEEINWQTVLTKTKEWNPGSKTRMTIWKSSSTQSNIWSDFWQIHLFPENWETTEKYHGLVVVQVCSGKGWIVMDPNEIDSLNGFVINRWIATLFNRIRP